MRSIKRILAGLAMVLLVGSGVSFAGSDVNEVGALLVFPAVAALNDTIVDIDFVETFVTITNAGPLPVVAHVSYINGDADDPAGKYCYECDFSIPLSGNDTETLVISDDPGAGGITITSEDNTLSMACDWNFGMLVVTLEDGAGNTVTDNVLLGSEVVVDYLTGSAFSIPAIPFQGGDGGNGDRVFEFDDNEYGKLPRIVAADFLAPTGAGSQAVLNLFTLGFERQLPPLTDCSVTGYDANENPFSASFQFGCWGIADLCDISPEFCSPNLGLFGTQDTHGWLQLNCRVDTDPLSADGFDANGGVHGAIIQTQGALSNLPAGGTFTTAAAWSRLLYQSVTTGDSVSLLLEVPAQGLN